MEEIAQKIEQLIEVINQNSIPMWIEILGIFIPIIFSIMLLLQSYRQNQKNNQLQKQIEQNNKKLQKELSEHEERVQMRGDILKIYDDFCFAQRVIVGGGGNIHVIFSNFNNYGTDNIPNIPTQWINDVNHAINLVCQADNRSKLLLPPSDEDLRKVLEEMYKKLKEIRDKADFYFRSGRAYSVSEAAWTAITPYNIGRHDYYSLMNNPPIYENFLKLCANDSTNEIEQLIKELRPLFDYDKFDRYFEPYLQMSFTEGSVKNGSDQ